MFVKYEKDRQEAELKKFYLPDNDDFGLDKPENFGTLTYYDDNGHYHEEATKDLKWQNSWFAFQFLGSWKNCPLDSFFNNGLCKNKSK